MIRSLWRWSSERHTKELLRVWVDDVECDPADFVLVDNRLVRVSGGDGSEKRESNKEDRRHGR